MLLPNIIIIINRMSLSREMKRQRAEPFENLGNETRTQIIPNQPKIDYSPPSYDYSGAIPSPASIGVRNGSGLGDVFDAAKGMAYYTDVIGFGASSSSVTAGMGGLVPLGINYFMPTYQKCPNGAQMWTYVQGIPKGDALGKSVQRAFAEMGFPPLQGLAPGIIEDTKVALNPSPFIQAVMGDPYPDCEQVTLPVGDIYGRTVDPQDPKNQWVTGDTEDGPLQGYRFQTKWVQKKKGNKLVFIDRSTAQCVEKTLNADGSPNPKPPPLPSSCSNEGFSTQDTVSLGVAAALLLFAVWLKNC